MAALLFTFDDLTSKDKAIRAIERAFTRLGLSVAQVDIPNAVKRTAGVAYKEVSLTFADSQVVTFRVKKTGDIFEVRLNKKTLPIKNQDDQAKAIKEVADAMDKGRSSFQKRLARLQVAPPKTLRTAAPKMEKVLADRKAQLQAAIAQAKEQLAAIQAQIAALDKEIAGYQAQ